MNPYDRLLTASAAPADSSIPHNDFMGVAAYADQHVSELGMGNFILKLFGRQKAFGDYLGVAESTVAGWMKSGDFPQYARRAALGAWYMGEYRALSKKLFDAEAGTVVRDGDTYSIVTVKEDAVGVSVGTITARGIPSFEDALSLTSVKLAWRMANELLSFAESADYRYVEEREEAHALAEATRLAWEKYHDHARLLGEHRERHQHSSAATPVEGL